MTTHTHIFQPLMGFAFLDTQNALCQLFQLPKSADFTVIWPPIP